MARAEANKFPFKINALSFAPVRLHSLFGAICGLFGMNRTTHLRMVYMLSPKRAEIDHIDKRGKLIFSIRSLFVNYSYIELFDFPKTFSMLRKSFRYSTRSQQIPEEPSSVFYN